MTKRLLGGTYAKETCWNARRIGTRMRPMELLSAIYKYISKHEGKIDVDDRRIFFGTRTIKES